MAVANREAQETQNQAVRTLPSSAPTDKAHQAWHTQPVADVVTHFGTNVEDGLSDAQVTAARAQYGPNELEEAPGRSFLDLLIDQIKNVLVLMLIGAAVIAVLVGDAKSAISIAVIVVLNSLLGVFQEARAEQAMAALKRMASPIVKVRRDSTKLTVPSKEIVPGDVIVFEAGDQIPADARLIEAVNMQVREAALTGEATTVGKHTRPLEKADAPLGDRANMVFMGTEVTNGRGVAVVTNTGMTTQLGRIATLLQEVETEPTPLQVRTDSLGRVLVYGSLAVIVVVMVIGLLSGGNLVDLALNAISIAVAVVPEALPAVITITLALGAQRMVKRNVLIRRLHAVETLGSVTTICSDKTGTLTQNKMIVEAAHTNSNQFKITGNGYNPAGQILLNEEQLKKADPDLEMLLTAGVLANDAVLVERGSAWEIVGDPTEGALLVAGAKAFIGRDAARERYPRVGEAAFTSERKRMSVIVEGKNNEFDLGAPYLMFVKGSPEVVMGLSTQALMGGQVVEVDQVRQRMLELNDRMASDGVRVLGFAYRPLDTVPPAGEEEKHEHDLVWIGLIGMIDAPRPEVREAVKVAGTAGIRPIMITGDHRLTALAIARDLGIARPNQDRVITGPELEAMPDEQLRKEVTEVNVFARVAPEHKLRIVRALQSHNQFVAMTGDGVNDAPALKQGNIGVAMGITGTDVTKEASDMILTDDNFASIISAVEEGRTIYGNVRKYVKYILTSNIGEVLTLAVTPLFGLPVPLLPMQTLYMNLVTDGVPALALAVDPPDPDVMKKKPYGPKESIFSRGLGAYMLRVGIVFGIIGILFTLYSARVLQSEAWRTMVFTMLCVAQMGHALVVRHERESIFRIGLLTNKWVLLAVGVTTALQLLLPYVPPLAEFFELKPMTAGELAICFAVSTLLFIYVELEKWVMRIRERNQKARGA